jgi:adenylate cyclase
VTRSASAIDREYAEAGLLDGLRGERRSRRVAVLRRLAGRSVSTAELKRATTEGRLAYLVMEDALLPQGPLYTLEQIARSAGLPVADVERWFRAMGRGGASGASADYSDEDLRWARLLGDYRELGLDEAGLFTSARILGRNIWATADAVGSLLQEQLSAASDDPEVGLRYAMELNRLAEFQAKLLAHAVSMNLRQRGGAESVSGLANSAQEVAVCFADLVGFSALGESTSPLSLARLAERLDELTTEVVEQPVRFVKTVGDAVMLISPDPAALAASVLRLIGRARGEGLPPLHAGIAWGSATPSTGDWIGPPVNLASRVSAVAQPDEVLVDEMFKSVLNSSGLATDSAGMFALKGFGESRELFRLRGNGHQI